MRGYLAAVVALAVLVALMLVADARGHHCKPGTHCDKLRSDLERCDDLHARYSARRSVCESDRAAVHWGQSRSFMRYLAYCESRFRWWAHNPSGASGLFQFMPSTFRATIYGNRSIWNPRWNAMAAGYYLAAGHRSAWAC